jgi:hypothetical protein
MLEFDLAQLEHLPEPRGSRRMVFPKRTDRCTMVADPRGAYVRCGLHTSSRAEIVIRGRPGNEHIAHVIVIASGHASITVETANVADALYRVWWDSK